MILFNSMQLSVISTLGNYIGTSAFADFSYLIADVKTKFFV